MAKFEWKDGVDGGTPLSADNLNAMQDEIYEEFINMKGKILWTNPNPTIAFEPQNITLNSDDYDELTWYFVSDIDTEIPVTITTISIKKYGTQPFFSSSVSLKYWVRRITYNSNTSYTVEDARVFDSSEGNIANTILVPLYVVGKKTSLFNEEI